MIGLDTNVVIRYLVQDDPAQAALANEVFEKLTPRDRGFIALVTAVEVGWVLQRGYKVARQDVVEVLTRLIEAPELEFERPTILRRALALAAAGADLGDAVIAESGRRAGCSHVVTFDRRAARQAGMELLSETGS